MEVRPLSSIAPGGVHAAGNGVWSKIDILFIQLIRFIRTILDKNVPHCICDQ
jgi:hypothetical protein